MSVDPPENNYAMIAKLGLPFPLLSDARGELAKLYGLWNGEEGVAIPAIVVVDRSGEISYLYAGSDFADRPGDEEIFTALDELGSSASGYVGGEPAVRLGANAASAGSVRPDRPPMSLDQLFVYYRGAYFTTVALKQRFAKMRDAFREVSRYQSMVTRYQEAIDQTREARG